jgi:hypothetical protein
MINMTAISNQASTNEIIERWHFYFFYIGVHNVIDFSDIFLRYLTEWPGPTKA